MLTVHNQNSIGIYIRVNFISKHSVDILEHVQHSLLDVLSTPEAEYHQTRSKRMLNNAAVSKQV